MSRQIRSHLIRPIRLVVFLAALLVWVASPSTGQYPSARAQVPSYHLLYEENFEDELADDWSLSMDWQLIEDHPESPSYGDWVMFGGYNQYHSCGTDSHLARYTAREWGDQSFTLKFHFSINHSFFFLDILSQSNPEGGLDRYVIGFGIQFPDDQTIHYSNQITKEINSKPDEGTSWKEFAIFPVNNGDNEDFLAEIRYLDGKIEVYIQKPGETTGSLVNTFEDSIPLKPGLIAFDLCSYCPPGDEFCGLGSVIIDDIEIWGPKEYTFEGRVYVGEVEEHNTPFSGAEVSLLGADSSGSDPGSLIATVTTDQYGSYILPPILDEYKFYSLQLTTPDGYDSVEALSDDGTVRSNNWIEFESPLEGQILIDNLFALEHPPPPPQELPLDGYVWLRGEDGSDIPFSGAKVSVYGADSGYPDPGNLITSTFSDQQGYFYFWIQDLNEFYSLRLTTPDGFESIDAFSYQGTVQTSDWIEFDTLPEVHYNINNIFSIRPQPPAIYTLSGHVYTSLPDGPHEPRPEVEVQAFGAQAGYPEIGELLGGMLTGLDGGYALEVPDRYEFYSIRVIPPPGFSPIALPSPSSSASAGDWIEYKGPLAGQTLEGNDFYLEPPPPGSFILSGYVYAGEPGGPGRPLGGVRVSAYDNNMDGRILLSTAETDQEGRYELVVPDDRQRYWIVRESTPPEHQSLAAVSEAGAILSNDTIELVGPLEGKRLDGNLFYLLPPPPPPPPPTSPPTIAVTPTPSTPSPVPSQTSLPPSPTTTPGGGGGSVLLVGGILGAAAGLTILTWLVIRLVREPGNPPKGPKKQPALPFLPPIRLVRIWLTAGAGGQGALHPDNRSLLADAVYTYHLQVQMRGQEGSASPATAEGMTRLDVVLFYPKGDLYLEGRAGPLDLPALGSSNELRWAMIPKSPGRVQVRACIYYRNVLLQSCLLDASVVVTGQREARPGFVNRTVDYVASGRLVDLANLPQPAVSIFTNQAADGSHWIGVFSSSPSVSSRLRSGALHTFSPARLEAMSGRTRNVLRRIEGERAYRMAARLPLDEATLQRREQDLVELAINGYRLYDDLFLSADGGLEMERLEELHITLQEPGIISVARCRGYATSLPWATLYDLPLDVDHRPQIHLCGVFKWQLLSNVWSSDGARMIARKDLLENPQACRSQAQCPLRDAQRRLTVCPFGFWGLMHQIEQPLQQVSPTPVDQIPPELSEARFEQSAFLVRQPGQQVQCAIGFYPGLPDAQVHEQEIAALCPGDLAVVYKTDRDQVLELLEQGGRHLYYLFCHGVVDKEKGAFMLKLGPASNPGYLSSASLDPYTIHWPEQPHPLVILNGCETMALTPELIHGFLGKLRRLGASGVIGSEIQVWTQLARPFGFHLIQELMAGHSVGEAFLAIRRDFQRQGNPLGLVYTNYTPANLHLHSAEDCAWCRVHRGPGIKN